MFWISYFISFVLASAIAIALMTIRLVLSVVGNAFGWNPTPHKGNAATQLRVMAPRSRR